MRGARIHPIPTEIVEIVNQIPLLGAIVDLPVGLAVGGTGLVIPPLEEPVQHNRFPIRVRGRFCHWHRRNRVWKRKAFPL